MGNWSSPLTAIVRPACARLGTLISRPMMNRRRMRPISEMSSMLVSSVTTPRPRCGPSATPARM